MSAPCPANRYWVEHTERLRRTFHALTGRDLLGPSIIAGSSGGSAISSIFSARDPTMNGGEGERTARQSPWWGLLQRRVVG